MFQPGTLARFSVVLSLLLGAAVAGASDYQVVTVNNPGTGPWHGYLVRVTTPHTQLPYQ
jgi:hypothetical protein